MELKEPKKKKRVRLEPKSSLPLVFGSKGELTIFHANLTALGSCIADPTEMEIIYKMGYFGKGSLSKSHPSFGNVRCGIPPVIRRRQWERRHDWITEVQKLSVETFFDDEKNENFQYKNSETKYEVQKVENENGKESVVQEPVSKSESDTLAVTGQVSLNQEKSSDIEILDNDTNNIQTNGENYKANMEIDEVVLDSTEEEDLFETATTDSYDFYKNNFLKEEEIQTSSEYKNESELQGKVLVLSDSDSDTENYLINIKPKIKHENFPVRETLHLTFEETFFLMYGLGCLRVVDFDGKYLNIKDTWNYFCKEQSCFLQKYVAYHYFRSKGWIVKPGLKYGGDFLLYKEGPPFYHSSYIVIIDVLDAVTFKRIETKTVRNMNWNKFIGLERLAESVGKEVLFAQILWPSTITTDSIPTSPEILSQFTVREMLWRRWKLSQDTFSANIEDDIDDNYSS